ncbi:hypothetical protein BDF19DRAFT_300690 [Syncephalis fuscata]|nr:hypothetical protein BDF19DRAFT_300690 [Syncephalis fuscata]
MTKSESSATTMTSTVVTSVEEETVVVVQEVGSTAELFGGSDNVQVESLQRELDTLRVTYEQACKELDQIRLQLTTEQTNYSRVDQERVDLLQNSQSLTELLKETQMKEEQTRTQLEIITSDVEQMRESQSQSSVRIKELEDQIVKATQATQHQLDKTQELQQCIDKLNQESNTMQDEHKKVMLAQMETYKQEQQKLIMKL